MNWSRSQIRRNQIYSPSTNHSRGSRSSKMSTVWSCWQRKSCIRKRTFQYWNQRSSSWDLSYRGLKIYKKKELIRYNGIGLRWKVLDRGLNQRWNPLTWEQTQNISRGGILIRLGSREVRWRILWESHRNPATWTHLTKEGQSHRPLYNSHPQELQVHSRGCCNMLVENLIFQKYKSLTKWDHHTQPQ